MMNGYFKSNIHEDILVFDMFFRKNPSSGGYTIIAGIEQVIDYIENLKFSEEDIEKAEVDDSPEGLKKLITSKILK